MNRLTTLFVDRPIVAIVLSLVIVLAAMWVGEWISALIGATGITLPAYIGAYLVIYAGNALALRMVMAQGAEALLAQLLILPFVVAASWLLIGQVMGYRQRRRIE